MIWVAVAFVAGMLFMWHVGGRLVYKALKKSVHMERGLARMDYDALLRVRALVDREITKRVPPCTFHEGSDRG